MGETSGSFCVEAGVGVADELEPSRHSEEDQRSLGDLASDDGYSERNGPLDSERHVPATAGKTIQ